MGWTCIFWKRLRECFLLFGCCSISESITRGEGDSHIKCHYTVQRYANAHVYTWLSGTIERKGRRGRVEGEEGGTEVGKVGGKEREVNK